MSIVESPSKSVTQLLREWSGGDTAARDQLMHVVYDELRRLAAYYLNRERRDHTLQPTALVHEAYLKLCDEAQVDWNSRAHFFGAASRLMRRILVDHARARLAAKRGGLRLRVSGVEALALAAEPDIDLIALDEALNELTLLDGQQSQIVDIRFFGGLSLEETAEALGISLATVKRDWTTAKAWLRRRLTSGRDRGR